MLNVARLGTTASQAIRPRGQARFGRRFEQIGSVFAFAMLAVAAGAWMAEQQSVDGETAANRRAANPPGAMDAASPQTMIAGYVGAPYTYPSNVRLQNAKEATDFTMANVGWDARPFKSPIYYGLRVARWGTGGATGMMVDFTHSKTISRAQDEVAIQGLIKGAPAPEKAKVGALFKHLEFSHGHNMLTLNGLARLMSLTPRISPYVGAGGGVSLPHTEVMMHTDPKRTYEYQYAGLVGQGLVGIEIKLASTSVFFEYKFTFTDQAAPLSRHEGSWLSLDLWRQATLWWRGETPPGGLITTKLASHEFISGVGYRF